MTLPPQPTPQVVLTSSKNASHMQELLTQLFGEQINFLHQKIQDLNDRVESLENQRDRT